MFGHGITAFDGTYDRAVIDNCGYRCLIETHPCEAAFNRAVVDEAAHFPRGRESRSHCALWLGIILPFFY